MLYQANVRVRFPSPTMDGIAACSKTKAAPRSRPIPLNIPKKAARLIHVKSLAKMARRAPKEERVEKRTRLRLRPQVSPTRAVSAVPNPMPTNPTESRIPTPAALTPRRGRTRASRTLNIPVPAARKNAEARIRSRST